MSSSMLIEKISSIQDDYIQLLDQILPLLKTQPSAGVLDAISLFWTRHIDSIRLFLEYHLPEKACYAFTAATCLDYSAGDHLPFLLLGNYHILDDPLGKYSEIVNRIPDEETKDAFFSQVLTTAEKNKEVLSCVDKSILVLPLRIMNQASMTDEFIDLVDKAFLGLLTGVETITDYFEKCKSLEDVCAFGVPHFEKLVLLSEDDQTSRPFNLRFKDAVSSVEPFIYPNGSEAMAFFHLVGGYLAQALDVIFSSFQYQFTPFIPTRITLHYVLLLSKCMEIEGIPNSKLFKMVVANRLYHLFDQSQVQGLTASEFVQKRSEYHFEEVLFSRLEKEGVNETNFMEIDISKTVHEELKAFLNYLAH